MSDSKLIIECGAAMTRAALLDGDRITKFWFGPARGDEETDSSPRSGRRFAGRVLSINRALNAAFVDVGVGLDAFLPLNRANEPHLSEGAIVGVAIKSPPRQNKGAVLKLLGDAVLTHDRPGRLPPYDDPVLEAAHAIGEHAGEIIVDDGTARAILVAADLDCDIQYEQHPVALFEVFGVEGELTAAFERTVPLPGGGRLVIDEAQALTAIDVDTAGLSGSSPTRLREKIAVTAACEAVRQISLRNIGGHIVIDFPAISNKPARARFGEHLHKAVSTLKGAGSASFSKSGLFSFTAPHSAQSLLERFTETGPMDPVSGLRFTLDWRAKSAIRELEHRLRAAPNTTLQLRLGAEIESHLSEHRIWMERLQARYGARFDFVADDKLEERGYDLNEQR